jgi:hypothetical protein
MGYEQAIHVTGLKRPPEGLCYNLLFLKIKVIFNFNLLSKKTRGRDATGGT